MRRRKGTRELTVGKEEEESNSSTDGEKRSELLSLWLDVGSETKTGVEGGREDDGDDCDSEETDVELSSSDSISLLVESKTSSEEAPEK